MPACPACGFDSPQGKRFCGACGASLQPAPSPIALTPPSWLDCPACHRVAAPTAKFCKFCGTPLGTASATSATSLPAENVVSGQLGLRGVDLAQTVRTADDARSTPASLAHDQPEFARPVLSEPMETTVGRSRGSGRTLLISTGIAATVLLLLGIGWYLRQPATPSDVGPDASALTSRVTAALPTHLRVGDLQIESSAGTGGANRVFTTRFRADIIARSNTFVESSREGGVIFVAQRLGQGAVQGISGVAVSRMSDGSWKIELSLDRPLLDFGQPPEFFESGQVSVLLADGRQSLVKPRIIVRGSREEIAFREEQRRNKEHFDNQVAQQKLKEADREAERIRGEAAAEAERQRLQLVRESEQKRLELEREAERLRAERAAQEATELERRREAELEAARQEQTAQQASLVAELPRRTEVNVRLSSTLNSGRARVEDRFEAATVEDVVVKNRTIIRVGSVMRGIVASVQPATRTNRTARMVLSFDQLTIDGQSFPIRATVTRIIEGPGFKGETGRIAAGSAVGAIIGGILGGAKGALAGIGIGAGGTIAATEGREVELTEGSILRVRIDSVQVR